MAKSVKNYFLTLSKSLAGVEALTAFWPVFEQDSPQNLLKQTTSDIQSPTRRKTLKGAGALTAFWPGFEPCPSQTYLKQKVSRPSTNNALQNP